MTIKEPYRKPNVICDLCSTPMYRRPSTLAKNAAKYCSRACRNKVHTKQCTGPNPSKGSKGQANPAWKGGVTIFKKKGNYKNVRYLRAPDWLKPMARKDGYLMEHRLVMAEWCGYLLTRTEVVHHVDHDPLRNDRQNLDLWPDNSSHKLWEHGRFVDGVHCRWLPRDSELR